MREDTFTDSEHDAGRYEQMRGDDDWRDEPLRPTRAEAEADERYLNGGTR